MFELIASEPPLRMMALPDLIENTKYIYDLILVDDCTTPEARQCILYDLQESYKNSKWLKSVFFEFSLGPEDRRGVAGCWNIGLRKALERDYEYCIIMNNDIAFPPPNDNKCWLERLVEIGDKNRDYAWISPAWYWTGEPEAGGIESFKASCWDYAEREKNQINDGGIGCFFMLRMSDVKWMKDSEENKGEEIHPGLFDKTSYPTNWEEVDYLIRLRRKTSIKAPNKTGVFHSVCLYHKGSGTTGSTEWHGKVQKDYRVGHVNFCKKWNLPHPNSGFRVHNAIYEYLQNGKWEKAE